MTTNQTIDGVPRELLREWLKALNSRDSVPVAIRKMRNELRALLDAPADPKPTGLSQGWNLTRKHDGFVVGHQSVAYPPDEKAIERAERDGYVWVPFLVPAAQPQGEPVAWMQPGQGGMCISNEVKLHSLKIGGAPACAVSGYSVPLYAEQPAPVAVVLPVDPERERLMEIVQQYPNVDPLKYDAAVRTLRK
ncbi:hypothetical protein PsexTeo8_43060 [Pseudomonas extremaustralis]|uniref:hypothetical protein n=1 Tax=Pseudomonas extremaustralis TaxID=359110 RepID=UPI002AA0DFEA|nr:hypothetical protein [Pseudomonas extremaustralis]MDY7067813.1 hypothetical protein [Pseudomonas extremaustralis]